MDSPQHVPDEVKMDRGYPAPHPDADVGHRERADGSELRQEGGVTQGYRTPQDVSQVGTEGSPMNLSDGWNSTPNSQALPSMKPKARKRRRAYYDFGPKKRPSKRNLKQAEQSGEAESTSSPHAREERSENVVSSVPSSNNAPFLQELVARMVYMLTYGEDKDGFADMSGADLEKSVALTCQMIMLDYDQDAKQHLGGLPSPGAMKQCISGLEAVLRAEPCLSSGQKSIIKNNALCNICKILLRYLKNHLEACPRLSEFPLTDMWSATLKKLLEWEEKGLVLVVLGDKGEGKSSLLNALLDLPPVLPTSGMKACTAVAIEIEANTTNDKYEAYVEFLSTEEWFDELGKLLEDIPKRSDNSSHQTAREPNSEAAAALEKVKAVYGAVFPMETLRKTTTVTMWLGKTRHLSLDTSIALRNQLRPYVQSGHGREGGEFWPIVKKVRLRIPCCPALDGRVTLVDLPGIHDANAARDRIAKDELRGNKNRGKDQEEEERLTAQASALKVFCVSAVEYCRFAGLFLEDRGKPQVFDRVEETQIPALRQYLHTLTAASRQRALEEYVNSVGQFFMEVQNEWTSLQSGKRLPVPKSPQCLVGSVQSCCNSAVQGAII